MGELDQFPRVAGSQSQFRQMNADRDRAHESLERDECETDCTSHGPELNEMEWNEMK